MVGVGLSESSSRYAYYQEGESSKGLDDFPKLCEEHLNEDDENLPIHDDELPIVCM